MHFCRKSILIYLVILLLVLIETDVNAARKKNRKSRNRNRGSKFDQCHQREVEKCLNKMTDLGKGKDPTAIIATAAGIDRLCKTIKDETLKCVKGYFKKCGSPIHREVSDLVMDTITFRVNKFCNDQKQRSSFLTHSPCFHKKVFSTSEYKSTCNNNFLAVVDKIETNKINVDAIHESVCCGYTTWEDCTMKVMKDKCGENGQKEFRSFLVNTVGRLTDMMCPLDVFPPQSDTCKKIHPKPGTKVAFKSGSNIITKYVLSLVSFLFVTN